MIMRLSIENFRSIRDRQELVLSADRPDGHLAENVAELKDVPGQPCVLKSVGLYGANAAGKSNVLRAFAALQSIAVASSKLEEGSPIPSYTPYLLSEHTKLAPVRFEVEFVVDGKTRYRYLIAFLKDRIVEEQLGVYLSAKESLLFDRSEGDTWETVKFGAAHKGGTRRIPFFPNQAYLSVAGNAADAPEIVRKAFVFLRKEIVHLDVNEAIRHSYLDDDAYLQKVASFISLIDTGICRVDRVETPEEQSRLTPSDEIPESIRQKMLRKLRIRFEFAHRNETGGMEMFQKGQESQGTNKLFDLAPLLVDALGTGGVLVLDELDNSMHPYMAELILRLFNDPQVNPGGAQLIFSTHNANLMASERMRRDQTWFVEKVDGATSLFSLDDLDKKKVTPTSPFTKWYIEGRFGAVPQIDYQGVARLLRRGERGIARRPGTGQV